MDEDNVDRNIDVKRTRTLLLDRPRLLDAIDQTASRVVLMLAPAGYGKTTLARQWHEHSGRRPVWLRLTSSAADVTVLAQLVANACSPLVDGLGRVMASRLSGVRDPEKEAAALAAFTADQISRWPDDAQLVIDDAHFVASAGSSAVFMETLLASVDVPMMLLSRRRPTWLPVRRSIYGEVLEIDQSDLAFSRAEVDALGLLTTGAVIPHSYEVTRGWPAVASLATKNPAGLPTEIPLALHDYFAEEIFRSCAEWLQRALLELAVFPRLEDRILEAHGSARLFDARKKGVIEGLVTYDQSVGYEIHPLLRTFLNTKLLAAKDGRGTATKAVTTLLRVGDWSDAFDIIQLFNLPELLPLLFERHAAVLTAGHLTAVERWLEIAHQRGDSFALLDLAEAEVARRRGRRKAGVVLALTAAQTLTDASPFAAAAYSVAAECLFWEDPAKSLEYQRKAEQVAQSDADRHRAIWGQITLVTDFPDAGHADAIQRYRRLRNGDPNVDLRIAAAVAVVAAVDGKVRQAVLEAEQAEPLLARATDPLARSHFLYRLSFQNTLIGRYGHANRLAIRASAEAAAARIDFVQAHILAAHAASLIGLRQLARAELTIARASTAAEELGDAYERLNLRALLARVALSRGLPREAEKALPIHEVATSSPSLRGECYALLGLIHALAGDASAAVELCELSLLATREVQTKCLEALARVVIAEETGSADKREACRHLQCVLIETEVLDPIVITYRAYPKLVTVLDREGINCDLTSLMRSSNDSRLAAKMGISLNPINEREGLGALSRREGEVLTLVCEGLTNKEMAERLFLAETTVKLHVRHILAKLGVRSRTEAALVASTNGDR